MSDSSEGILVKSLKGTNEQSKYHSKNRNTVKDKNYPDNEILNNTSSKSTKSLKVAEEHAISKHSKKNKENSSVSKYGKQSVLKFCNDTSMLSRNNQNNPKASHMRDLNIDPSVPVNNSNSCEKLSKENSFDELPSSDDLVFSPKYITDDSLHSVMENERRLTVTSKKNVSEMCYSGTSRPTSSCPPLTYRTDRRNESGLRKKVPFPLIVNRSLRSQGRNIVTSSDLSNGLTPIKMRTKTMGGMDIENISQREGSNILSKTASKVARNRSSIERQFNGILHCKMRALRDEINRLKELYRASMEEHSNALVYEGKVKELAAELTEMQAFLTDLNTAADSALFHGGNIMKGNNEVEELRRENHKLTEIVEKIFLDRLKKEEAVSRLEKELQRLKHKMAYSGLMITPDRSLQKGVDNFQREIELLNNEKYSLDLLILKSPMKYQVLTMEKERLELKNKIKTYEETYLTLTSNGEWNSNDGSVASHEEQISSMEKRIIQISEEIKRSEQELSLEKEQEDCQKRQIMFRELVKEEQAIEDFLCDVAHKKDIINDKINTNKKEIYQNLEFLSKQVNLQPTIYKIEYHIEHLDGHHKQDTNVSPLERHKHLIQCLDQVQKIHARLSGEYGMLDVKIKNMKGAVKEFDDCHKLNQHIKEKDVKLKKRKREVELEKSDVTKALQNARTVHSELEDRLGKNEQQVEISRLENQLSRLAEINFTLFENMEDLKTEINIDMIKSKALDLVENVNCFLIENLNNF